MGRIVQFVKGNLEIQITGQEPIRFINLCRMRGIYLWNIKRDKKCLSACMKIQDYFFLHDILRKTGTKATVMKKNGMPFFIPVLKKRIIFFLSVLMVFFYLVLMSNYIWRIEYTGNVTITEDCLCDFFRERDIACGIKKKSISIHQLEFELRKTYPQITWVCISLQGTKMQVSIKENERMIPPDEISQNGQNLVADQDGTIISIITRKGIPQVKKGSVVKRGDILVCGNVPVFNEEGEAYKYQIYNADATIIAKTQKSIRFQMKNSYEKKRYTGRSRKTFAFVFYGKTVKIPMIPLPYENSEITVEKQQCRLLHNLYLPYFRYQYTIKEYQIQHENYSEEECKKLLSDQLEKFMLSLQQKGVQIIQKNVRIKKGQEESVLNADFILYEKIGIGKQIEETNLQTETSDETE